MSEEKSIRRFLTIIEASELLRWTPKTIYDKIYHGQLPFPYLKTPRLLFEESDILEYLDRCKIRDAKSILTEVNK